MSLPAPLNLPAWYDRSSLDQWLQSEGQDDFATQIRRASSQRLSQPTGGELDRWWAAIEQLPPASSARLLIEAGQVKVDSIRDQPPSIDSLTRTLMELHPWRKGPFGFLGIDLDTEWRSDWKWERVGGAVDLHGAKVLDVGCGNGYFGWRMLQAGASVVLGIDPTLRFVLQFEAFRRYAAEMPHWVVPMIDTELPEKLKFFDVVFSMGVLYHRTSPIDHLRLMAGALVNGGQLILETLIIEDDQPSVLVPEDRYAKMRNVWFLPSISMLTLWLRRCGFGDIQIIDVNDTTTDEQRSTPWMTFHSLKDFLNPDDPSKTAEGYAAPRRATLLARKV